MADRSRLANPIDSEEGFTRSDRPSPWCSRSRSPPAVRHARGPSRNPSPSREDGRSDRIASQPDSRERSRHHRDGTGSPRQPLSEGGDNPDGFDCSGFTRYVFARHNIALPRLAADQCHAGTAVSRNELVAEDLVFFETIAPESSHVGVAIGIEAFVHAPGSRGEVRVEPLSSSYWAKRCVGARRIVE